MKKTNKIVGLKLANNLFKYPKRQSALQIRPLSPTPLSHTSLANWAVTMWRSTSASWLLRRGIIAAPARWLWPECQFHPIPVQPRAHLCTVASTPTGDEPTESITQADAKRLMRLVNVETLKRRLGMEGAEVIGYSKLLVACEEMGVARSKEEAEAFARVLEEAGVVLLFRDQVYLHPDKVISY